MTEDQAKLWAKDKNNQQKVIDSCITKDTPDDLKLAIFMAGIPGAGKTEFVRGLTQNSAKNMLIIEHDQLVEHIDSYTPERYYHFRKAGSVLVTKLFDYALEHNHSFIFDGTLSHENGLKNIQKSLNHKYRVIVIYIHQDMKTAWELTVDRELVKKRSIEKSGFIDTCNKITSSLKSIFHTHKTNPSFEFWVLKKNGDPGTNNSEVVLYEGDENDESAKKIEEILNIDYNVKELE